MTSFQDITSLAANLLIPQSRLDAASLAALGVLGVTALTRGRLWDKPDPYNHLFFEVPQQKDAAKRSAQKLTRNVAQKLEETVSAISQSPRHRRSSVLLTPPQGKQLAIFWGSQSGTAEGFANRLAREFRLRFGIDSLVMDLSDYDAETLSHVPQGKTVIFLLSTFGEGDPCDNSYQFWDWINKLEGQTLPNLQYTAFGLGNSNYKYYNRVVDVVTEALDRSGAKCLLPTGKADDAKGATEEDFLAWKTNLFSFFRKGLGFEEKEIQYEPTMAVVEDESLTPIDLHHGEPVEQRAVSGTAGTLNSPIKAVSVKHSRELFSTSSGRNCIHMELDLSNQPEIHYKTGDHLAVWPINPDAEVDRLLNALGLFDRQNIPISIKSLDSSVKLNVPTPTSTSALFRYYLEICSPVSREALRSLALFAPSPEAKSTLLAITADKNTFANYSSHNLINLGNVLTSINPTPGAWSTIPLSFILETLSAVKPRYYSISSSSIVSPRTPSITAVVSTSQLASTSTNSSTNDPTSNTRVYGLTTNYLLALSQSLHTTGPQPHPHGLTYALTGPNDSLAPAKVHAHIRKSKFKLPTLASNPIIMVAAGTGIAPFRGFVAERARFKAMGKPVGRTMLFFGCRHPDEDFLYADELASAAAAINTENNDNDSPNTTTSESKETMSLIPAFSRQTPGKKVYVQHRVAEHAEELCELLLNQNANFYICGSTTMAREVAEVLGEAVRGRMGWGEGEWKEWSLKMKRTRKWMEDVWG